MRDHRYFLIIFNFERIFLLMKLLLDLLRVFISNDSNYIFDKFKISFLVQLRLMILAEQFF